MPTARGRERDRLAAGYVVDVDDDGEDGVVFFCPRCAARELGSPPAARGRGRLDDRHRAVAAPTHQRTLCSLTSRGHPHAIFVARSGRPNLPLPGPP
jgi:hypothetical protein